MVNEQSGEPTTALDDPRLQFFLENRPQLREWFAIADEVADAVEDTLRGLAPDITTRMTDDPATMVTTKLVGESPYGSVLFRPTWAAPGEAPFVGVSLAWDGRKVDPVGDWPGTVLPYVGVVTSKSAPPGQEVEQVLRSWMKERFQEPYGYLKGSHWVAYRKIQADANWWQDVPGWREWVIDQLVEAWRQCSPVVDDAVAALSVRQSPNLTIS